MKHNTPNGLLNVHEHIVSKAIRANTLFSINTKGIGTYHKDGRKYTPEQFNIMFPLVQIQKNTLEDACKGKKMMSNRRLHI